jgi:predicted transcriptional regulator
MELQLSTEQEAELSRMAHQSGKSADELAREVVAHYLEEERRFRAGVQAGLDAAECGDFVPTSEVWARVERVLRT